MANLTAVRKRLELERRHLTSQLEKVTRALVALRGLPGKAHQRRRLSAAAISRIRAGQRVRWAKWRKAQKKVR